MKEKALAIQGKGGVEDLMPILGIGRNTAYELVRSGQIKGIRIGKQIRIPKNEIIGFLNLKST